MVILSPVNGHEPLIFSYLPPPAQAQAQPAQAQAQAQLLPPPPPLQPRPLEVDFGTGLVLLVTRLVKSPTLPMTFWENPCTPPTTEAAKSAPGRLVERDDGTEVGADKGRDDEPIDPP
jgi:hypothetical protein